MSKGWVGTFPELPWGVRDFSALDGQHHYICFFMVNYVIAYWNMVMAGDLINQTGVELSLQQAMESVAIFEGFFSHNSLSLLSPNQLADLVYYFENFHRPISTFPGDRDVPFWALRFDERVVSNTRCRVFGGRRNYAMTQLLHHQSHHGQALLGNVWNVEIQDDTSSVDSNDYNSDEYEEMAEDDRDGDEEIE